MAEAAKVITGSADEDAKVIFGANVDESMGDALRITVVATGFDSREKRTVTAHGAMEVPSQGMWSPSNLGVDEPEKDKEPKRVPTKKEDKKKSAPKVQKPDDDDDDDELEIPTFIRKKMM